jgi:acyl carrier protein
MSDPTDQALLSHIDAAIRAVLVVDDGALLPSTALVGDLGAESIDFLDISCEIEKRCNVEIDFKKLVKARQASSGVSAPDITVQDILTHVQALRADVPA